KAEASPGMCGAVVIRIRTGFENTVRQPANYDRRSTASPAGALADLVAAIGKLGDGHWWNALVQNQVAAIPGVIVEARNQVASLKARRLHGILGIQVELQYVE